MLLNVIEAKYLRDYVIRLTFNNGDTKTVDLKDYVFKDQRKVFQALRDINYFKQFEIKLNTVTWPNELDPAPEFLYNLSLEQERKATEKVLRV